MRIPFRIKFFVVLLAFSLGPIFISRGIMNRAANKMADSLSEQSHKELLNIISGELEYNAVGLLAILEARGQSLALGVRMLAKQAEHYLSWQQAETEIRPYFSIDFSDPDLAPPDAVVVDGYTKQTMSGKMRPLRVSFGHPSFHLSRGVRADAATKQINRLLGLLPTFKEVYSYLGDTTLWMHVALDSGVYMTYPGHGNFPMMYDPRNQGWYKRVGEADASAWTIPAVDPTTRLAVATVGYPVRNEKGEFVGAASIDVPISSMLHESDLKSRWSGEIRSFMIKRVDRDDSGTKGLSILAQQSHDKAGHRHWMSDITQDWLVSDDSEGFRELLQVMGESDSGVVRLSFKGEDSVWAFASNPNFSFLLIAPESVVSQLPDQVSGSLTALFTEMRDVSAIISGVMLIITGLIAWFGSRVITRPLLVMADVVRRLAGGDFSARMTMRTGDERDIFIDSFNEMGPKLKKLMLISKDLELAQEVQKLLLPRTRPQLAGYDISGGIAYCDQTGGDYYDFIEVNCESGCALGVVLGDVSGHGVPSALVMATARAQLHSMSKVEMLPETRIAAINKFLSNDLDGTGRFLTLFYLQLEERTGLVRWVRAGHDPAIRYMPETGEFGELGGDGLALGVLADFEFQGYEEIIGSGEILTLATDGVWEARNPAGEMFGKKRMLAIIRDNAHKTAEDIRKALMDGVAAYQEHEQEDDIAVVVIKKV